MIRRYLAGEGEKEIEKLKEHTAVCEKCNRFYEEALKMERIIADVLSPIKDSPTERIMRRIEDVRSLHRRWRRSIHFIIIIVFVATVVMFLTYLALSLVMPRIRVQREILLIRDGVSSYIRSGGVLPESETEAVWAVVKNEEWAQSERLDRERRQYLDPWGVPYRLLRQPDFWMIVSSGKNRRFEYGGGDDYAIKIPRLK
jgi:hypothetical protein